MKKKWLFLVGLALGVGVLMGGLVLATGEEAVAILRRVEEKQATDTSVTRMGMFIYPDAGAEDCRSYEVVGYAKGDQDEYISFLEPRSIKGLTLLAKGDDQWIYFPSTGRVRKIASKAKDQSIQGVGGDFSYEDISAGKWEEKYDFIIAEATDRYWVLAGTPKKESAYAKVNLVIDKEKLILVKVEYYKENEGHFKDLIMEEIKTLDGREIATRMRMMNYAKNSKTVIVIYDAKYNVEIDDKYFNPTRFYR
ncbi:MAG TPA: outer membrane lipoprotein-sorting protein [Capillibacterium sp.]